MQAGRARQQGKACSEKHAGQGMQNNARRAGRKAGRERQAGKGNAGRESRARQAGRGRHGGTARQADRQLNQTVRVRQAGRQEDRDS
jgi:hypothetical protein